MKVDVYIQGQRIDIYDNVNVSFTKQINEFTTLGTREFSYTNRFRGPKTARNKRIFKFLSYPGNTSDLPYIRVDGAKMNFNGIPVVVDGYAEVQDSTNDYNIVIYEGSVNFYETIKNQKLSNLDWTDTDHDYTGDTVSDSWSLTEKYVYPHVQTTVLQQDQPDTRPQVYFIDQPAPCVYLKDILLKIGQFSGYTIAGSLLSDTLYQNAVVFPEIGPEIDFQDGNEQADTTSSTSYTTETVETNNSFPSISVPLGYYRIRATVTYSSSNNTVASMRLFQGSSLYGLYNISENTTIEFLAYGDNFRADFTQINLDGIQSSLSCRIEAFELVNAKRVEFAQLFGDIKLKDFLANAMVFFGSQITVDNKNRVVSFDFISDYENANVVDLSRYYSSSTNESYVIGNYVQNNEFSYTLDSGSIDESSGILFYSENKKQTKRHFTSLFQQSDLVGDDFYRHICFEDKKPKKSNLKIGTLKTIDSDIELTFQDTVVDSSVVINRGEQLSQYIAFDFSPFHFEDLLGAYYRFVQFRLFDAPLKITVEMGLPLIRFYSLDLRSRVYLQQEGANFIVNKIKTNSNGKTTAELIKISKTIVVPEDPIAVITGDTVFSSDSPGLSHTFTLSSKDSSAPKSFIVETSWRVLDESDTEVGTGESTQLNVNVPAGETWTVELTITNGEGLTDIATATLENIIIPPVISFTGLRTVAFSSNYSLIEITLNGTPNGTFNLRVVTSLTKGGARTTVYDPTSSNCWLADMSSTPDCPVYLEYLNGSSGVVAIPLDSNGEATIQISITAFETSNNFPLYVPVNTDIRLYDQDNGNTISVHNRTWT